MSEDAGNIVGRLIEASAVQGELNPAAMLMGILSEGSVNGKAKLKVRSGIVKSQTSGSNIVVHNLGKKPICIFLSLDSELYSPEAKTANISTVYQPVSSVVRSIDDGKSYIADTLYVFSRSFAYYESKTSSASRLYRLIHEMRYSGLYGNSYGIRDVDETKFTAPTINRSGYQYRWTAIAEE